MVDMLDDYIAHLEETKNMSLIARVYGLFTVKTNRFAPMEIMMMQNTAQVTSSRSTLLKFDLKGSSIGRYTSSPEIKQKFWKENFTKYRRELRSTVMKDKNLREINLDISDPLLKLSER